jgi:hypothetical protein
LVTCRTTIAIGTVALGALAAGGCGGSQKFANRPKPPLPINVTVYIDSGRVSVSPDAVGAGPVVLQVTNQAAEAESMAIMPPGGGNQPLASTGPIPPKATAQIAVNLKSGNYSVTANSGGGSSDSSSTSTAAIQPGRMHVGAPRPGSRNVLLTP